MRKLWLLALSLSAVLLCAAPARAQAPAADDLKGALKEVFQLESTHEWAQALAKLRALQQVPLVRFHVAYCEQELGHLVDALRDYRRARTEGEPHPSIVAEADTRIAALTARIPTVRIERGAGASSALVSLDGSIVRDEDLGVPLPLDPGPHLITATRDGTKVFAHSLTAREAERSIVVVIAAAQAREPAPVAPPPPAPGPRADAAPDRWPAYAVGGLGIASLVASGVFIGLRQGAVDDLDAMCTPGADGASHCPTSAQGRIDQGRLYTGVAEATFVVGVVGVTGAMVFFATSGKRTGGSAQVRVSPAARAVSVSGTF